MGYDYKQLNELLGAKDKKIMHRSSSREGQKMNTWLERHEDHIGLYFVESEIMRYYPDGTIVLDSCGWQTHTTKQRMNDYLPWEWGVSQVKGLWHLFHREKVPNPNPTYEWDTYTIKFVDYPFSDGITLTLEGTVTGHDAKGAEERERLLKQVNKYVKGYVEALVRGDVPAPGLGDCWDCSMRVVGNGLGLLPGQEEPIRIGTLSEDGFTTAPYDKPGQTRGEANGNGHLLTHFEEKYYVPTLLENAIETNGLHDTMSPMAMQWVWEIWYGDKEKLQGGWTDLFKKQVRNCLKKYLRRQLGLPS